MAMQADVRARVDASVPTTGGDVDARAVFTTVGKTGNGSMTRRLLAGNDGNSSANCTFAWAANKLASSAARDRHALAHVEWLDHVAPARGAR